MLRGKYRNGKTSLPLLVTITGCVLMFACLSPAGTTEITKQLAEKGYQLSRRNISELRVVVNNAKQARNILESLHLNFSSPGIFCCNSFSPVAENHYSFYSEVFNQSVKRLQYEDLRSWLKQE